MARGRWRQQTGAAVRPQPLASGVDHQGAFSDWRALCWSEAVKRWAVSVQASM